MPPRTCRALLAATAALFLAGEAAAATLGFTGTLSIRLGSSGPPILATGSGTAQVNGSGSLGHLSQLAITASDFGPVTASVSLSTEPFSAFQALGFANQTGSFGPNLSGGPPGGGVMGVSGLARICLIWAPCEFFYVDLPIASTASGGLGIGGTQTATFGSPVTIEHAPWTLGVAAVTLHTAASHMSATTTTGFAHGAASGTSNTAQPSGALQLVTISKAWTAQTGAYPELTLVSTLTLHFVPEPGGLALAAAALVVLAARRWRQSL